MFEVTFNWSNKITWSYKPSGNHLTKKGLKGMTNVIRDSKIKRQSMKAFMNIFMYSLTAIFFAIVLPSCNKPENAINPVSNDGISPDNSQLFKGPVVPIITSISPTSAEIGDLMTITGSKFGQKGNSGYFVTIKGIKATVYQSWSSTQIKVLVPSGSTTGSGNVSVTANNKKATK